MTRKGLLVLLFFILIAAPEAMAQQGHKPSVTFQNRSGQDALVKLIGPTPTSVEVLDGQSATVHLGGGEYYILVRYGRGPDNYRYSKGESFQVVEEARRYSRISITLHKVQDGNYSSRPVPKDEFERALQQTKKGRSSPALSTLRKKALSLRVDQSYPGIQGLSLPVADALKRIFGRLGVNVAGEKAASECKLLVAVEGAALGASYTSGGKPKGYYYTGARTRMTFTLAVPGRDPIVSRTSFEEPPSRTFAALPLPKKPADAPFDRAWPRALLKGLSRLLGPDVVNQWVRKDITRLFKGVVRDAFLEEVVEQLENQQLLAAIARTERITNIREKAVMKLKDEKALAEIARKDRNQSIRRLARSRLKKIRAR